MFTSIVRHRVAALITAAAAAAAVLGLVVPAGASTGARQASPEQAGYTATGAQFKTVHTHVYLRDPAQYKGMVARYGHSVQLWSADVVVTVGLTASTSGDSYTNYATIYNRHTHQVIASNPDATWTVDRQPSTPPGSWHFGQQVILTITYYPADGYLYMAVGEPNNFTSFESWYTVPAQSFTEVRIGTDFGRSPWDASYSFTLPSHSVKVAAYTDVSLTSYSGHTATLWSWWVHHKLIANSGHRPVEEARPYDLTNGGASFQTWCVPHN